eukprot:g670.t1
MEKFNRVDKKKEGLPIEENEVRVTAVGRLHNYINYAATLYNEKGKQTLVLKGMGRAINKTVTLAEILKRRIPNLHQLTNIGSVEITDSWEPKEEGLNELEITRHVSVITITLSTEPPMDTSLPGYQPPLPEEEVKPLLDEETTEPAPRKGTSRGRGKGVDRGSSGRGRGKGIDRGSSGKGKGVDRESSGRGRGGRRGSTRGRGRGRGRRAPAPTTSTAETVDAAPEAVTGIDIDSDLDCWN